MLKKIFSSPFFYPSLLTIVLSLICFANYVPNTYLTGWDNLMPELNIWMNLKRSLFAVWQEYQGLGLVGGMGHATDLIRQLIILPFTLVLPTNLIRYLWHFAMLFLGTFGIYFGVNKLFLNHKSYFIIPFSSALFYLLNFGTIQYFWAPLETFSTFWGFFPWLIFFLFDYLETPNNKNLKKIFWINLLAIPSFYVQTLFVVYMLCVSLILFSHFVFHFRSWKLEVGNSIRTILLILLINSFWLLPQIYFLKENLHSPIAGIGNFMSSEESFTRNQNRGYLSDFLILRNYYIDFPDSQGPFMAPWIVHFSSQYILICGYIIGSLTIFGLIFLLSAPKQLSFKKLSVVFIFLLSALTLLSATPPFSGFNTLIRFSDLLNQIFRAPFTKFIVPTIFSFSLLIAYGLHALAQFFTQIKYSQKVFTPLFFIFYFLLLFTFSFPVFKGNLFSSKMRQTILPEYFEMFRHLQAKSPTARISNLPSGSFWGWTNYLWGYRGSGFIWYSLPQPILDRAFDAWNLTNEQYYWEINLALQKRDPILLSQVLKKYSIEYILFDNNIYFPDEFIYAKQSVATPSLLLQTPGVFLDQRFGNISLYRTSVTTSPYLLTNPTNSSNSGFLSEDSIYVQHQDYISTPSTQSLDYPFVNLFTNRLQNEIPYQFKVDSDTLSISRKSDNYKTTIPLDNSINITKNKSKNISLLSNRHNSQLLAYNFPSATLSKSYLIQVNYQYLTGLPLTISVNSDNLQQKYLYTKLDKKTGLQNAWFVIPARETENYNQGITVVFNNTSFSKFLTQNKVVDVNIYPIPLFDLIRQSSPKSNQISSRSDLKFKSDIYHYQVDVDSNSTSNSTLVLPQSFSPGWLAFYFNCKGNALCLPTLLSNHVLINNWANGWLVSPKPTSEGGAFTIYIFFWPQLLQFLGFGLLIGTFIWILKKH
ncbi:hypothetical protein HYV64_04900 [Candidatus Shapirobacteria bacterium]|nr:hypothetical protein [Candidatus Shapirobacteria bacterium]